jgi:hypothetical protein
MAMAANSGKAAGNFHRLVTMRCVLYLLSSLPPKQMSFLQLVA